MSAAESHFQPIARGLTPEEPPLSGFYSADNPFVAVTRLPNGDTVVHSLPGMIDQAADFEHERFEAWRASLHDQEVQIGLRDPAGEEDAGVRLADVIAIPVRAGRYSDYGKLVASCAGSGSI